jgi:serine/threonine protein kinase
VDTVELPMEATRIDYSELELTTEVGMGNSSIVIRGIWKEQVVAIKRLKKLSSMSSKDQQKLLKVCFPLFVAFLFFLLNKTNAKDFKAEVELLSSLKHPNLVNCLGYCENPYFIVMEYLTDNLHDYFQKHKRNPQEILHFAFDIAKG